MNPLYAKVAMERPKAAVFDLDGTIFDNFQRVKDARRAGLIDNHGKLMFTLKKNKFCPC